MEMEGYQAQLSADGAVIALTAFNFTVLNGLLQMNDASITAFMFVKN